MFAEEDDCDRTGGGPPTVGTIPSILVNRSATQYAEPETVVEGEI
jgi:hypothetical protein